MGLILDSTVFISAERSGQSASALLDRLLSRYDEDLAIAAMTVTELAHGIARAETAGRRQMREAFLNDLLQMLVVHPLSAEFALRAGLLDGDLSSQGMRVATGDLLIGATALGLDYGLLTANVRHFKMIPGLRVVQP